MSDLLGSFRQSKIYTTNDVGGGTVMTKMDNVDVVASEWTNVDPVADNYVVDHWPFNRNEKKINEIIV